MPVPVALPPWRALAALLLLSLAGSAHAQGRAMSIDDVLELRAVGSVAVAPDGARVLYTVAGWEHPAARDTSRGDRHEMRSHVWLVSAAGGDARQLTFGERGESAPQWSPDGSWISFIAARGTATGPATGPAAGEDAPRPQLWIMRADGGEAWQLTTSRDGVSGYVWSPDGSRIAFVSTDSLTREGEAKRRRRDDAQPYEGEFRFSHAWVVDVRTKAASKVTSGDFTVRGTPTWSPDGTRLAVLAGPTPLIRDERREAFLVDVSSRERTPIATPPSMTVQSTPAWSPDGTRLAFSALLETWKPNADGMYPRSLKNDHLILYDIAARRATDVTPKSFDLSVGAPLWSRDGRTIRFSAQDRVWNSIFAFDIASGSVTKLTRDQMVRSPTWSRDERVVAYAADSPAWPAEVVISGPEGTKTLTATNPQLAGIALGETEVITWKSTEGYEVEGILLKPVGYRQGERYPLLVVAHGGPTGAHTNGFKASSGSGGHYWAGRGWATLYPNVRGSTGYGEKFMRANIMDWGGGDYRDLMTGVDEVVRRGIADSDRLAVAGWSYGGYMTGWVVSQTPRFKAAMMGAGLSNMVSMYGTTDIPGYIGTFYEGMPTLDGKLTNKSLEFYRSRSAITYADRVTTPLLMLHGANDERVPIGQPMEYFRHLKDRGKTVELVFYPREGHGLSEYYHQVDRMKREYDWIARHTLAQKVLQ